MPFTENYTTVSVFATSDEKIQADCEEANTDNICAIRSCTVESLFVLKIFQELFLGNVFDESLKHDFGFDTSVCKMNNGNVLPTGVKHCCGDYSAPISVFPVQNRIKISGQKCYFWHWEDTCERAVPCSISLS